MNMLLWILQILLAAHTVAGAVWKFSNSEQSVPSLKAIPHPAWLALGVIELVFSVCLLLPAVTASLAILAPVAAVCIAAEMLLFGAVHFSSGTTKHGQAIYWLVVALFCGFIAYGRWVLSPL